MQTVVRRSWLVLLVLTGLVYLPVAQADFVWDDQWLILDNPLLSGPLIPLLRADFAAIAQLPGQVGYWRPLLLLDYWLDQKVFGLSSAAFHLHSLGWHLLAVALLFRVLRPLGEWPALAGAALLALHPACTEAVAWVSARNDPMCAALLLASILLLRGQQRLLWPLGALLGLGAFLTKETALIAPLFLLFAPEESKDAPPSRLPQVALLTGSLLAGLALRPLLQITPPPLPDFQRLLSVSPLLPSLLGLLGNKLLGISLSATTHLRYLSSVSLSGCLCLLLLAATRKKGLLLAAASLLPAFFAVVQTGIFGDRYLYLPMVGLAFALGESAQRLRPWMLIPPVLFAIPVVENRLLDWQDGVQLFTAEVQTAPTPYNRQLLAWYLLQEGRAGESLQQLLPLLAEGVAIPELYDTGLRAAIRTGRYQEALEFGEAGLKVEGRRDAEYRGLLAVAAAANGQWNEAERWGESTLEEAPEGPGALAVEAARHRRGEASTDPRVRRLVELGNTHGNASR